MMNRTSYVLSFIVAVTVLLFACQEPGPPASFECTDVIGCVNIAPGEPIEIGVLQALSGSAASLGVNQARSIELAIARQGGQLLGHPIEVRLEDSRCSPEGGTNAALNVVTRQQVVAILGPTCSGAAVTAGKIMSEKGLVMISGSTTAPSLTATSGEPGADWQSGYFRTVYNDTARGQAVANFAFQELGVSRAAVINDGDPFTKGLTDVFGQTFTELGGELVLDATVNRGDTDMHPVLAAVANSGAELLFLPLFPSEAGFIVQQAKVAGLENIILVSNLNSTLVETIGTDGIEMYFVAPVLLKGLVIDELIFEYRSRYGEPPSAPYYYGYAYDSVNLLLNAIEAAAIQEDDGTLHIGRQALRDGLYATSGFEGVSGMLNCDRFGDCATTAFDIVRLDDPAAGIEGLRANVVYSYIPEQ